MVEGSARARLGRTLNTRTTMAAQKLNLQVGEEVDFFRAPTTKDASGWFGPAEVIDVSRATRGVITVKWQSRVLEVQIQNLRRHLHFLILLAAQEDTTEHRKVESVYPTVHNNVWTHIKKHCGYHFPRKCHTSGTQPPRWKVDQNIQQLTLPRVAERHQVLC